MQAYHRRRSRRCRSINFGVRAHQIARDVDVGSEARERSSVFLSADSTVCLACQFKTISRGCGTPFCIVGGVPAATMRSRG
jgi:hypothetical protein